MRHNFKQRLLALVLVACTMLGLGVTAQASSIADGSKTCTVALAPIHNYLETQLGTYLRAGGYIYTTNDGITGPAYCIDHGLAYTNKVLPITGKYNANPATAGAFSSGYPQTPLETFHYLYLENNDIIRDLTEDEYRYATQLAVWATLGQLGIDGTKFTQGREYIYPPSGDVQQARVFRTVQLILNNAANWDRVYQTGMYIRRSENALDGNVAIPPNMTLEYAAMQNEYGIQMEVINGKSYYTMEYIFASATSTYWQDYTIDVWATNCPAGTIFTDMSNHELPRSTWHEIPTWRVSVASHNTKLNYNGWEYSGHAKLCIPVDTATPSGEITIHEAAQVMQYEIYLANNESNSEQSYIIADPSKGTKEADCVLSWGGIDTETGRIQVNKVGGGGSPLEGARFVLTGTDGSERVGTTDAAGIIVWQRLQPGITYTLTEVEAPAGYAIVEPRNVTVAAAHTTYVTVQDDPMSTLTVHKQDVQNGYSLYGATFAFEQIDGDFKTTAITDHAGNIQFNADELPRGSYKVYEVQAPAGFNLDRTVQTVNWDGKKDITLTFKDVRQPTLVISKKDSQTKYNLPGASFEVYKNGSLVTTVTTNDAGLAYATGLGTGYYEVKEVSAPHGYLLNNEVHGVYIDAYDPAVKEDPRLVIENDPMPSLTITKYDRETGATLAGATFKVYKDASLLGTYTTDRYGEIHLTALEPGTYLAEEVSATAGYVVDTAPQQIEIVAGQMAPAKLVFFNSVKPGIHILKVDEQTLKPLSGAVMQVKGIDTTYNKELTTDKNGCIDLSLLTPGTYQVEEITAPANYVLEPQTRTIEIVAGQDAEFVFTNLLKPSLTIHKVSYFDVPLGGVAFTITPIEDSDHEYDRVTTNNGIITLSHIDPGVYSVKETFTKEEYILDPTEYHVELKPGRDAELTISNDKRPNLTIRKLDADTDEPVPGTIFQVKNADGAAIAEVTTGRDGTAMVRNMLPGVYEVVEMAVPSNYLLDAENQLVTLNPNEDREVTFHNHQKPGLTINKVDSITGDPIEGVKFSVTYASNNTGTGEINVLGTYTTDANGQIFLDGLRDGWYKVKELEPKTGYAIKDSDTQECYIKSGTTKVLTFENTPLSAIVVFKYDSVFGTAVEGATFQVKYLGGTSGTGGTVIGTYKTSANGSFSVTKLKAGTYVVEEVASDENHVIDSAPQVAYLTGKDQDVVQLYFGNAPKGSLTVTKVDGVTNAPLSDVDFLVTQADGSFVGNDNGKFTTDSKGQFTIAGLVPGTTLVVKETKAKDGYVLDDVAQTVTIKAGQSTMLEFRNTPKSSLTVKKIDSVTRSPLSDVEFLVTRSDGSLVGDANGKFVTDASGSFTINGIEPNSTFVVKETKAKAGYILDDTAQTITVQANQAASLEFRNQPKGNLIVLKKDSVSKEPLAGATFKITFADGSFVPDAEGKISSNGIYTTDSNGQIKISNISGTLVVTEIESVPGYLIDESTKTQTVVVNAGDTQTLTFFNKPTTTLVINKYVEGSAYEPLAGVTFQVSASDGSVIGPNNGRFVTDAKGKITITGLTPGLTVQVQEVKTVEGFKLDGTPQSILIKEGEVQSLTFWNVPIGQVEIIKVNSADTTERIPGVTFEIRKVDGGLIETITTGSKGRVSLALDDGDYYAVEIECPEDFKLDSNPHYFTIKDGRTTTLTIKNDPFSGILIHKVDSTTGKGIYGATFLLYNSKMTPIGQYVSDQNGYVYIDGLTDGGRYYLRELSNEGYVLDTAMKTVYVTAGETTLVEWKNTPITGQIQITKTSADYNSVNGWAAGTAIPDTYFEVYNKAGVLLDTIRTDKNGVAITRALPLGQYKVMESQAAANYVLDKTPITVEIEFAGQIVRAAMTNKSLQTGVSITKVGYTEVMPGQMIRYGFKDIANTGNTNLTSFYWRDTLPTNAVRLSKIVTGTWNANGSYKIVYKTNLRLDYRTLADNLSTHKNYTIDASPVTLGLASNEYVTEIMYVFGVVPAGFRQVEMPYIDCTVLTGLVNGFQFVNNSDVGGVYANTWVQAVSRWTTKVYAPTKPLPRTGY